ncbi:hypothetical protein, partial [Vibrio campbellii]|uniref:hypothetical protein n=1 Tax=Vibrio campbellii TaxID=680 RepID=UPI003D9CB262
GGQNPRICITGVNSTKLMTLSRIFQYIYYNEVKRRRAKSGGSMNLNYYQVNTDELTNDWDIILESPLLVMRDIESVDIPSLEDFIILPVGTYLYKVTKLIRRVDEISPNVYKTTDINVVVQPALID